MDRNIAQVVRRQKMIDIIGWHRWLFVTADVDVDVANASASASAALAAESPVVNGHERHDEKSVDQRQAMSASKLDKPLLLLQLAD